MSDTSIHIGSESCSGGPDDLVLAHFEWHGTGQQRTRSDVCNYVPLILKHGLYEMECVPTFPQLAGVDDESIMDADPVSD